MALDYSHIYTLANVNGINRGDKTNYSIHAIAELVFLIDSISLLSVPDGIEKRIILKSLKYSFYSLLSLSEVDDYKKSSYYNDDIDKDIQFAKKFYTKQLPYIDIANALVDVMKCSVDINRLVLLLPFAQRTEMLLQYGGDDRLTLDINSSKLNKYFSSTIPRVNVLRRGSCTCSTISLEAYLQADTKRVEMLKSTLMGSNTDKLIEVETDLIRSRIFEVLQIPEEGPEVVLFPSGSDAEFLPLLIAIARATSKNNEKNVKPKVFNYVVAAGEVGSGTPNAATGKHFSVLSPKGSEQKMNDTLKGLDGDMIETILYKPRSKTGSADFLENEISLSISQKLSQSEGSVAILHLVVASKTGLIYPSMKVIDNLKQLYQDRLLITVDACQLRCRLDIIKEYINQNFVVLITGSKFYTGPPFSGAVVLPLQAKLELENYLSSSNSGIVGLRDYLTKCDIPLTMPEMKRFISDGRLEASEWYNPGLLLRWHCALPIMEAYRKLDAQLVLQFTQYWIDHVKTTLKEHENYLKIVEVTEGIDDDIILGNSNTIISVAVYKSDKTFLNADELKEFHSKMTQSLSIDNDINKYCEYEIMLGQPVKLADSGFGVVRIALGADMVVDALSKSGTSVLQQSINLQKILNEDMIVIKKMALLSRFWNDIVSKKSYDLYPKFKEIDKSLDFSEATILKHISGPSSLNINKVSKFLKCISDIPENIIIYDIDAYIASIKSLKVAFENQVKQPPSNLEGCKFLHCFAIKSCPLSYILHIAISCGLGLEAASIVEVKQALRCGCIASKVMFDSPCKSSDDLYFALKYGVHVNANTIEEVERISTVLSVLQKEGYHFSGKVGLRINPLVGAGSITALSTATNDSKFGIPLVMQKNDTYFGSGKTSDEIIQIFLQYRFLTTIMCHVGSQGMPLDFMVEGATKIVNLADQIDNACGEKRISCIDIGKLILECLILLN